MNDSRDVINLKTSNQTTKQEIELVWYFLSCSSKRTKLMHKTHLQRKLILNDVQQKNIILSRVEITDRQVKHVLYLQPFLSREVKLALLARLYYFLH